MEHGRFLRWGESLFAEFPRREGVIQPFLEVRDSGLARRIVLEGLFVQSVRRPEGESVPRMIEWAMEALAEGIPLPPLGFIADLGHLAFREDGHSRDAREGHAKPWDVLPSTLVRQYEDWVLGKLYTDRSFDRAVDALRRYADRRDQAKGLAFVLGHLGSRAGYRGVMISPAVLRDFRRQEGSAVLAKAAESLAEHGPVRLAELEENVSAMDRENAAGLLEFLYRDLIAHVRNLGEVLGKEDVFELEHGTAIAGYAQRIALRQVLSAQAMLERDVPQRPVRPLNRRHQVATKIVDEDTYPIGGFSSISNRGSIESLLHSQLAFMEPDDRPDLFDIKFLREELLYYSRDENQFHRRRRSFVFGLFPDLTRARQMDPGLPWQRIILLWGMLRAAVERLTDWLSEDALRFEFVFLKPGEKKAGPDPTLSKERELLEMLLREPIANDSVCIRDCESLEAFQAMSGQLARQSLCHVAVLSTTPRMVDVENALLTRILLDGPVPRVWIDEEAWTPAEGSSPIVAWSQTLLQLLKAWIAG
jgi:hypothetical protein